MKRPETAAGAKGTAAVAETRDPSRAGEAIRQAVELAGGMDWLEQGHTVLLKPALNSAGPFPFVASPAACAVLVRMCLERGAAKVYVADETGFAQTALKHWKTGKFAGFDKDLTIKSFKKTGIYDAVMQVAQGMSAADRVHITTFREEGWRRHEFSETAGQQSTLHKEWVRKQLKPAEKLSGEEVRRVYIPRFFDRKLKKAQPGLYVPTLMDNVDHVINVFRVSTHLWSHYTMAIKNWVGIMRPDDRVWFHQLNYLKNNRHAPNGFDRNHPIRSEPLYHELLADLHLPHADKERLCVADATEIVLTGGPDDTDKPFCRPGLVLAADDIIAADVVGLAILRYGALMAPDGLHGECEPQPAGWSEAVRSAVKDLSWPGQNRKSKSKGIFRGTDSKLCDPQFSNWDWVAVQRARELGLGVREPDNLQLVFPNKESEFAVAREKHDWIAEDARRAPMCELQGA